MIFFVVMNRQGFVLPALQKNSNKTNVPDVKQAKPRQLLKINGSKGACLYQK